MRMRRSAAIGIRSPAALGRQPWVQGTTQQICHARKLLADPEVTVKEVAASLKANRAKIYRALGLTAVERARVGQVNPR